MVLGIVFKSIIWAFQWMNVSTFTLFISNTRTLFKYKKYRCNCIRDINIYERKIMPNLIWCFLLVNNWRYLENMKLSRYGLFEKTQTRDFSKRIRTFFVFWMNGELAKYRVYVVYTLFVTRCQLICVAFHVHHVQPLSYSKLYY